MKVISSLFFLFLSFQVMAKECAKDSQSFRNLFKDKDFPMSWTETTADDGKPLNVIIVEKEGSLFLTFEKTKEGLWANGTADICLTDDEIVASISKEQIKLGDKAPWPIKMSMKSGAKFTLKMLKPRVLKISTFGWSGEFIPMTKP